MTDEQANALTGGLAEKAAENHENKEVPKSDEENLFVWDDIDEDESSDKGEGGGEKSETKSEEKPNENKEWWQIAAEKVGKEAKSEDEFLESLKKTETKEIFVDEKDPEIRKLKNYTRMSDEDLVREDKKARGWDDEKIDRYIEKNKDGLEFQAEDIRSELKAVIKNRQQAIEAEGIKKQREQADRVTNLQKNAKEYLSKTTEVLGFKVGKDEAATQKWQKGMETYLTNNGIFKDIDSIVNDAVEGKPERLIELAQFIKAKDGIAKGLMQKGKSQEAKKFLEDLQNSGQDDKKPAGETVRETKKGLDNWVI